MAFYPTPTGRPIPSPNPLAAALTAAPAPTHKIGITDQEYEAEAKAIHDRLAAALADVPDVNWEEKFAPLLEQAGKREIPKTLSPWAAFAGGIGAPGATQQALSQSVADNREAVKNRENDILSLKQAILQGDIQQLMQKGNFKKALAQADALHEIERITQKNAQHDQWKLAQNENAMKEATRARLIAQQIEGAVQKAKAIKGASTEWNAAMAANIKTLAQQAGVVGALYDNDQALYDAAYRLTVQQLGAPTTEPLTPGTTPPSGNTEGATTDPTKVEKMAAKMRASATQPPPR